MKKIPLKFKLTPTDITKFRTQFLYLIKAFIDDGTGTYTCDLEPFLISFLWLFGWFTILFLIGYFL